MAKHARRYKRGPGTLVALKAGSPEAVATGKMREQLIKNDAEVIFHGRHRKD